MENNKLNFTIASLLDEGGIISSQERDEFAQHCTLHPISADGSLRQFFRVIFKEQPICVGVLPNSPTTDEIAESHTAVAIGNHLFSKKIPVPEIFGADSESGLILFEDCGDCRLHDFLENRRKASVLRKEEILHWYKPLLATLARMQIKGAEDFDTSWCFDTPVYDLDLMISKESEYFLEAFWYSYLNGRKIKEIHIEFQEIAFQAGKGLKNYFLHRDFQSRNMMIKGDTIKIIDFQGGRYGPPGYDLASLLIDPYIDFDEELREDLLKYYCKKLSQYIQFDENVFLKQYSYLRLQRNLQIVGAFAYLFSQRGKQFFKAYINPALEQLYRLLQGEEFKSYTQLRQIVSEAHKLLIQRD